MQNLLLFHAYSSVMLTEFDLKNLTSGTSLAVQWLRLCTSTAGDPGSIPGRGTKIPHATRCSQKTKTKTNKNLKAQEGLLKIR